ncbi:uncharacterized protein LOC131939235 isoform X2 [Physella acuta]|uniref:uncharacterized protein LOC131939235 isoform X2 n=1 Tax=Physella acuta TaxID=109671 RepID=UPI0027DB93BA|nr:uncharacterized protein LOC131939235 isoform X2 [Physella acuta]
MKTVACVVFVVIAGCCVLCSGQSNVTSCVFTPVNKTRFIEGIYEYFNQDSDTRILEYHIQFVNISDKKFDFDARASEDAFQPSRWFRTQGESSSQLLLVNNYYYGMLKPFITPGIVKVTLSLRVSPPTCLDGVKGEQIEVMIRDYLLLDFNIDGSKMKHPFKYSDDVEICTAHISDNNGWGRLLYRCCGLDNSKELYCDDVFEDDWVWALRAFIISITCILFLYFPMFIPEGYRFNNYVFYPKGELKFHFILTTNPETYRDEDRVKVLKMSSWKKMSRLSHHVEGLEPEKPYVADVRKVTYNVCMDKLLVEGASTTNARRSFFNAFVRCKIRQSEALEECCDAPFCGTVWCRRCPAWKVWLRATRTVLVMFILALPSLPFMYAMTAENMDYQQMSEAFQTRGLTHLFNFYLGKTLGRVTVGVLASMYILHTIIIIVDGATEEAISKLYNEVLDVSMKKKTLHGHIKWTRKTIRRFCFPVRKFGVLTVPLFFLLSLVLVPAYFTLSMIIQAPTLRIFIQAVKMSFQRSRKLCHSSTHGFKFFSFCRIFGFFVSLIFVFIVLTIGTNFLVHVLAMVIVTVVVEADFIYRVLPVVLLFVVYIRDSYSQVGEKYDLFFTSLLNTIKQKEAEAIRRECLKSLDQQQNKIFQIVPEPLVLDDNDDIEPAVNQQIDKPAKKRHSLYVTMWREPPSPAETKIHALMTVKNEAVSLYGRQLVLFLNREDILYMSKKFFFHCCTMDCAGAPGNLVENYIKATLDFAKVGLFLLFVFMVVMAYGSVYYISPANHLFVTLVSGLVPLIVRNIFCLKKPVETVNTSNYRFEAQLKDKIESFGQSLDAVDIDLRDRPVPLVKSAADMSTSDEVNLDLILDLTPSEDVEEDEAELARRNRYFSRARSDSEESRGFNEERGKGRLGKLVKGKSSSETIV